MEAAQGQSTTAAHDLFRARRIAPSILSADFSRLGAQVEEVMAAGARVIHVDVMDGHFVPPITIGPLIAASIADQVHSAGGALDVHLMVERPEDHVREFVKAGADCITFHTEATPHANRLCAAIREQGSMAGVAINPGTPVEVLGELGDSADLLLCMTVNPGWGGQSFIESSPEKVRRIRELVLGRPARTGVEDEDSGGSAVEHSAGVIEVDGGIDATSAPLVAEAGASLLVAGSAVFGAEDPADAYSAIASACGAT